MGDVFEIGRKGKPLINYCNLDGAMLLKQQIEDYWRDRGRAVNVTLHGVGFVAAMRFARTDVRSDMRNGYPVAALPSQQEAA
jgi:hypothetical protein